MLNASSPHHGARLLVAALRLLGDKEGHPFYGNQHTDNTVNVDGKSVSVVLSTQSKNAGDVLVPLSVDKFDQKYQREGDFYVGPGGTRGIGERYERFGEFVTKNESIIAPDVSVQKDGTVGFSNGRHRYAWLRDHGVRVLSVAMSRESAKLARQYGYVAGKRAAAAKETRLHQAADAKVPKFSVAIRYAFAMGRKALSKSNPSGDKVALAVRKALEFLNLPKLLLQTYTSGGEATFEMMRTLGDVEGHPFYGNQWTAGSGGTVFHGTSSDRINSIKEHGIKVDRAGEMYQMSSSYGKGVFVAESLGMAGAWAKDTAQQRGWKLKDPLNAVVVQARIPKEALESLREDPFSSGGKFFQDIKPEWIEKIHQLDWKTDTWRELQATEDLIIFIPLILTEFRAAKKTSTQKVGPFNISFDGRSEEAVSWADRHAAELIDGITETTRETINNAIAEALEHGTFEDAYKEILEAVGDEARAQLIAHHETMLAVHEGQREAWNQATEEGLLTGNEEREFIITGDDKVCPICEGLEGKRAKLGESYVSDDGEEYPGPPIHPRCRCTEGIAG